MLSLSLSKVTKSFSNLTVIKSADLQIEAGQFVVFVGPSGCGKSTLLRLIAGLEPVTSGDIVIGDRNVTHLPPIERKVAMVFQSYALYPHMSVGDNIAFGLKIAGMPKAERLAKARDAARLLQLEPLLDRKPKQLSGGQRQRVAIGRAIVKKPGIFLFDEPLSNLDAELRVQMRLELAKLHQDLQATMIYVTHDQVEAMTLADRIVVLRDGMIEQIGAPLELYNNPKNEFVAGFLGSPKMNFFDGVVEGDAGDAVRVTVPDLGGATITIDRTGAPRLSERNVRLGIRPEAISISPGGAITGRVEVAERLGNVNYIYAQAGGRPFCIESKDGAVKPGDTIEVAVDPGAVHAFSQSGDRI
jgi:lactose/L-arabinose transport system ATP-binding protein